jgi:hypothetical protein
MKILELPVNKHYFNEAQKCDIFEDYREIKEYWIKKLLKEEYQKIEPINIVHTYLEIGQEIFRDDIDLVKFKNGYDNKSPQKIKKFVSIRLTNQNEMTCMGRGIAFAILTKEQ